MRTALQVFWDKIAFKLSVEQTNEFLPEFEQAKEIEKQQIKDAYRFPNTLVDMSSEQYYNETFKKK
jgi:hypothetical protein